jgi:hypothetical protein
MFQFINNIEVAERRENRRERVYLYRVDALTINEERFISLYRLPSQVIRTLIEDLRPFLPIQRRRSSISVEVQASNI